MNWAHGSMASEYWTRCGVGMVSFSLRRLFRLPWLYSFVRCSRAPRLATRESGQRTVIFTLQVIVLRDWQTVHVEGCIVDMRQKPPSPASTPRCAPLSRPTLHVIPGCSE